MERHWAEQYVGLPYAQYDCAQLCVKIQKEQFNKSVGIPAGRPTGLHNISDMILDLQDDFAVQVSVPVDGDAVLMVGRGRLNHIGTICYINEQEHVVHAMRNVAMTVIHKIVALKDVGLSVEGYYRWK